MTCTCQGCHELEANHEPDECPCMTDQNDNFERWIDEQENKV